MGCSAPGGICARDSKAGFFNKGFERFPGHKQPAPARGEPSRGAEPSGSAQLRAQPFAQYASKSLTKYTFDIIPPSGENHCLL